MTRRGFLACGALAAAGRGRPNILLAVSDDQSWAHTGVTGEALVRTPAFDRVAREGVLFNNAFCVSPSCAPSRASLLTGQPIWRLREGANMRAHLPAAFPVYTRALRQAGYHVGLHGKGYGPTAPGGGENPAGPAYPDFRAFLEARPKGAPFCFWFGSTRPHRPYPPDGWKKSGKRLSDVRVPPFLPDCEAVRADLLNYFGAIEVFDRQLADLLDILEQRGEADNTIVAVTSDNGMSFPRGKCNLYDAGTRMPLAVRWPARVAARRVVDDFISFVDFAPTFLEAAGTPIPAGVTGASFLDVLLSPASGRVNPRRDRVFLGRERHSPTRQNAWGYPIRAMRTREFLYVRNCRPERWPAGDPPGSADVDPSPTRQYFVQHRPEPCFELAFARRPAVELYDLKKDPAQLTNVAGQPRYREIAARLGRQLDAHLRATADPRAFGRGDEFDRYPFWGPGWNRSK